MKITNVEAMTLIEPIKDPIKAPISIPYANEIESVVFREYRATLVKIETDEGITGWGECMVRLSPTSTRDIIEYIKPVLIGKDPLDTEMIWEYLFGIMMNRGHYQGFFVEAISGVDCALWDIKGKYFRAPVYKLLGASGNPRIMAYASSIRFRGLAAVKQTAQAFQDKGFRAMKIKIGQNPRDDIETVRVVRETVGPDIQLMVDANCGYDTKTAIRVGKEIEQYDIKWFEEPVAPDNFEGYRRCAEQLSIPIAGGEAHFLRWGMKELIVRGSVSECLKIHGLARGGNANRCRQDALSGIGES